MEPEPHEESSFTPLSQVQRIDQVCDQFEAAWKAGPRPRFDDFLAEVPPAHGPDLLRELLILDLDYRRQLGESPTLEQYRSEYPALELDRFAELFTERPQPASSSPAETTLQFTLSETETPLGQPSRIRYMGDYELLAEIAHGGMGVVYKARQVSLNRVVAVKMILAGQLATKADHDRFHAEAQAAALLDHPNIVPVFEVGEHEGQHYFSMGYVDGQSLSARLAEGPLPPKDATELVAVVAEAVEYAHRLGVIHRDIKPSNILIDCNGRPRVTDFGLAKRVGSDLTMTGQVLGTPSYMPPEQAAGQINAVGPAADVYALGATLYAALTGRPPFQAATPLETLKQVIEREPVPLRQLNAAVPRDLETIVLKCLEKSVPRRYATAQAVADELRRYLEGRPIVARPVGRWERAWRWCRRQPVVAGLTAAAVLLMVLVAVASTVGYVSTSRALRRVEDAQRERALAQVDALRRAEISQVPYLIEGLKPFRAEIEPQLRQSLQQPDLDEKERLRLSLAMVAEDAGKVPYLYDRLLIAEPAELLVIRDALLPYRDELVARLWRAAGDSAADKDRRFRAACALAAYAPDDQRWKKVGVEVPAKLITENSLVLGKWIDDLRPVSAFLAAPLADIIQDETINETRRITACEVVAAFAADDPGQFQELEKRLAMPMPGTANDEQKIRLAKQQANVAAALLRMNQYGKMREVLKQKEDPSARSYLIHRLRPWEIDPKVIWKRLETEKDVSIRRALALGLGEMDPGQLAPAERESVISQLVQWYRNDPDPGMHGATEWLLRHWNQEARIAAVTKELPTGKVVGNRLWYTTGQGQTMVVVPGPVEFLMGSPPAESQRSADEKLHLTRIGRTFAVAAKAVTFEQFLRFRKSFNCDRQYAPTGDCPSNFVIWYEAAEYCNWLSEQEKLPPNEWCYERNFDGKFAAGMKLAPNHLKRTGYRLPTEAEWEYACRARTATRWYCGQSEELLAMYGWYSKNSSCRTWPVGSLKPNEFGLFDMHGNLWAWCHDSPRSYDSGQSGKAAEDSNDSSVITDASDVVFRGGGFGNLPRNLRSADRRGSRPRFRNNDVGFRVARTMP